MKVNFLLFCDAAAITDNAKLILHGVFAQINAVKLPALHPSVAVAFQLEKANLNVGDELRFTLEDLSDHEKIFDNVITIKEKVENKNIGQIINLVGVPLKNFGEHLGTLFLNGQEIAKSSFEVTQIN